MASHHFSSSALGGRSGLYLRSPVAGASLLGVKAASRRSCARRVGVTCAQRAAKSGPKTEDRRWGLNLWGTTKKAAVANGKSPAVRGTQQVRRRPGTAKVQKPAAAKTRRPRPGDKMTAEMVKAKQNAAKCLKDIATAERRLKQLQKSGEDLGERAATLQMRAREFQSAERGVAASAVAAQKAAEKAQKDLDMLRSKADVLAKQEAAARAVLSAIQNAARTGTLLTKQEQDAIALPILQPEVALQRAEAEQRKAELAQKKAALAVAKAVPKAVTVAPKAAPVKVQMTEPMAPKVYAPPTVNIEDLEAKAGEAKAKGNINEEARLRAQAASEARRQATEKAIAERAAKLEADQRAREAAAEEARKAILVDAQAKAVAATKAKREGAAKKKIADAAKQKAKAEAQREAQRAAQEKEKQMAQAKAEEEAKKQAEAKAKEEAQKKAAEESAKAEEEAKKIAAAKAEAAAQKKKAADDKAQAIKAALEAKKNAVAAAKAKRPPPAAFKWPWEATPTPAPVTGELVERREDAQEWIDNWKNGAPPDKAQEAQKKTAETSAKAVEAKPKAVAAPSATAEAVKTEKKSTAAVKAKRPAAAAFRWPWEGPPDPEELVQRRQEAQEWIDNWKARCAEDGKK